MVSNPAQTLAAYRKSRPYLPYKHTNETIAAVWRPARYLRWELEMSPALNGRLRHSCMKIFIVYQANITGESRYSAQRAIRAG